MGPCVQDGRGLNVKNPRIAAPRRAVPAKLSKFRKRKLVIQLLAGVRCRHRGRGRLGQDAMMDRKQRKLQPV